MATPPNPSELFSPFLPATYDTPNEEDRLDVFLVEKLSAFADVINDKQIGAYTEGISNINGNKFGYDTTSKVRTGYQYLIRIKSFPNAGSATFSLPPEYTPQFALFIAWGSASKSATAAGNGDYFSFFSEGNSKVTFTITDLIVTVTTTINMTAYSGFICIDFIPDGM